MSHMTYPEAMVVGLIQGVTELFPASSLGHNVLIPALVGGSWAQNLNVSTPQSQYLSYIVGLHVATAIGLMVYFWRDWLRLIGAFFTSLARREVTTTDQKLAWMIIWATVPVGIAGLLFEKEFRVLFGKPVLAAVFLAVNGVILFAGEKFRTRKSRQADLEVQQQRAATALERRRLQRGVPQPRHVPAHAAGQVATRTEEIAVAMEADERLTRMSYGKSTLIGSAQILALLAGISRDGVTMVAGMFRGLSREDSARFAFLLATPVIFAAGALKIPDLVKYGHGIYGQVLVGSILSGIGAYLSVRYLVRYFRTRTLTPFAIYCFVFGVFSIIYLQVK